MHWFPYFYDRALVFPSQGGRRFVALIPEGLLAALLVLCAIRGIGAASQLTFWPDPDVLRDIGFIQGFLDANWFGDPVYANELRWYPPLIHALGAALVRASGIPVLTLWTELGPWLNLLTPLTFFLMTARLLGRPAAAAATLALVLVNGATLAPSDGASYTPWPFTPNLALPFFFFGIWLISARANPRKPVDALLIGSAIGLTFLAQTVPALLLSAIVTVVAFAENGVRWRTILWLAIVAAVELAWSSPFLYPLIAKYGLRIANPAPGAWTDLIDEFSQLPAMLIVNGTGIAAVAGTLILRQRAPLRRRTNLILATWVCVCLLFLLRHEACDSLHDSFAGCQTFVLPAHHFLFYLQAAWACLLGHVTWQLAGSWLSAHNGQPRFERSLLQLALATVSIAVPVVWIYLQRADAAGARDYRIEYLLNYRGALIIHAGWTCLIGYALWLWNRSLKSGEVLGNIGLHKSAAPFLCSLLLATNAVWAARPPFDFGLRQANTTAGNIIDLAAYSWILENTGVDDLFVTERGGDAADPGAFAVIAAGRRLAAAPLLHSNPYVAWEQRNARRNDYLAAIARGSSPGSALCELVAEAGPHATARFLLKNATPVSPANAKLIFQSETYSLYQLNPDACPASSPQAPSPAYVSNPGQDRVSRGAPQTTDSAHTHLPPSTSRATPVMNSASSEAR